MFDTELPPEFREQMGMQSLPPAFLEKHDVREILNRVYDRLFAEGTVTGVGRGALAHCIEGILPAIIEEYIMWHMETKKGAKGHGHPTNVVSMPWMHPRA